MIAVGKASVAMTAGLVLDRGVELVEGVVIGPAGTRERVREELGDAGRGVRAFDADHPLPTERNVEAARHATEVARRCGADGTPLVVALSGGASAHLSLPREAVALDDLRAVTRALLRAGATIYELNTVRKRLEQLKGGGLARIASPAAVDLLVLSDVVGDDLSVIGSGPVTRDVATASDAIAVLRRFGVDAPSSVIRELERQLKETTERNDDGAAFSHVRTTIVGSNAIALDAAAERARSLGFAVMSIEGGVQGESREVGRTLARRAIDAARESGLPRCMLIGGETTVRVRGEGVGGRNQEVALAAAIELAGTDRIAIASFGTDGVDGPTDAAGAFATGRTCGDAKARGVDAREHLERNDSHPFFATVGSLIRTGATGTNVNDVAMALIYGP